jgi:hypothetical protein
VTTLLFFRQIIAEGKAVWVWVLRTRLPLRLTLIGLGAIGMGGLLDAARLPRLVLVVALTATVTAAATLAGPHAGRATAMTLRHPASALALATGRWLAVAALAAFVTFGAAVGAAWQAELGWREGVQAAWSAAGVALPMAACGLLLSATSWRRTAP